MCESTDVSATYTLTPPAPLSWTDPIDATIDACTFDNLADNLVQAQADLDADIASWVATNQAAFVASGGCSPTVTSDFVAQSIDYCTGGSITITWTVADMCESTDVSATYTLTPPAPLSWTDPIDATIDACTFDNLADNLVQAQADLDADIASWVATNQAAFVASGGCSPTVTSDFVAQSIDYCTGGSITITWTVADMCESTDVSATYTLTPPAPLSWTDPIDATIDACTFDNQLMTWFRHRQTLMQTSHSWVSDNQAAFTATGGCITNGNQ